MSKPTVRYSDLLHRPTELGSASLIPIDHPRSHLNGKVVFTSGVLSFDEDTGRIETFNTVYVPE